jgi:hypothetical protein
MYVFWSSCKAAHLSKVNFTFVALDRDRDFTGRIPVVHHDLEPKLQNVISKFNFTFLAPNRNANCSDIRGIIVPDS